MLKRLPVPVKWTICVASIVCTVVFVTYKEHGTAEKYQRQCQANGVARGFSPEQKKSDTENCQDPTNYLPWWYALVAWPEGITAWALLLTLGAITWQAWETRKAAEAALKQADHTFASERAWILAELSLSPGPNLAQWTEPDGRAKAIVSVKLHCFNDGTSPAWVVEKSARLVIASGELPKVPHLAKEDILDEGEDPIGPGKDFTFELDVAGDGQHSVHAPTIIYGVVKYRDVLAATRETWFCYQLVGYQENRKLVRIFCGPGYSRHT